MKKMKKQAVSLLLVLAMVLAMVTGCGNNGGVSSDNSSKKADDNKKADSGKEETVKAKNGKPSGKLIIGDTTELTGDFLDGWSNGASDMYVRYMFWAYKTAGKTKDGSIATDNNVVKKLDTKVNDDGSKTFTFTINDKLTYSDGSKITAKDYVFYYLINSCKGFAEAKGDNTAFFVFKGYDDFSTGKKKEFTGVRLLGDYQFSATLSKENVPDFFELTRVASLPYPMAAMMAGSDVDIKDDGNGAYFTKEVTKQVMKDTVDKYRWNPTVVNGPYKLKEYNKEATQITLEANENYIGNFEGQKPQIKTLIIKKVEDATEIDELKTGSVDVLSATTGGNVINAGQDLTEKGDYKFNKYYRNGYGKLVFTCDLGPTQFVKVRQAIAYLLDRTEFASQYTGGYGAVVNGYYGLAQNYYTDTQEEIDNSLNPYSFNVDKAKKLLVEDGWTLNKDGKEFKEGTDTLRYKKVKGKLMPLVIEWANTANNPVSDLIATMLPDQMKKVGMKLNATTLDWNTLTQNIYRKGIDKLTYNMFNMGTGFSDIISPEMEYGDPKKFGGVYNGNWIDDKELAKIGTELKKTDSSDLKGYEKKWVELQKRWNAVLPDLPLYSNEYYDFYNKKVKNFIATDVFPYPYAIVYAYVDEK